MSTKTYQQIQLENTPARAILFLRAIATDQGIRSAMFCAGYNDLEQAEGWRLVHAASGYSEPESTTNDAADTAVRQAIADLDNWDESGFRRAHAALERLHPEQDAFVFNGLEASRGPTAVLGVAKFLDRLDTLEKGSEAERAAIATLTQRGITPVVRQQLRELITVAQTANPVQPRPVNPTTEAEQQSLEALFAWYKDWSETARAVIRRRDQLILLGLAKRKSHKDDDDSADDHASATPSNPTSSVNATTHKTAATSAAE
jgi:hypothetical protein